jgi:hypothetical protein
MKFAQLPVMLHHRLTSMCHSPNPTAVLQQTNQTKKSIQLLHGMSGVLQQTNQTKKST